MAELGNEAVHGLTIERAVNTSALPAGASRRRQSSAARIPRYVVSKAVTSRSPGSHQLDVIDVRRGGSTEWSAAISEAVGFDAGAAISLLGFWLLKTTFARSSAFWLSKTTFARSSAGIGQTSSECEACDVCELSEPCQSLEPRWRRGVAGGFSGEPRSSFPLSGATATVWPDAVMVCDPHFAARDLQRWKLDCSHRRRACSQTELASIDHRDRARTLEPKLRQNSANPAKRSRVTNVLV
jgi:hypothetical protein